MIERTEQRMGLKPQRLAADTAYGTGKFLNRQFARYAGKGRRSERLDLTDEVDGCAIPLHPFCEIHPNACFGGDSRLRR
jgi:hypothetical protein